MNKRLPELPQAGFTLVEVLIVVTISVMLLLTASSLFMTLLIGSTKTNSSTLIKQQGNITQQQLDFLLRNAVDVGTNSTGQTCNPSMTEVVLVGSDGGSTTLRALADAQGRYRIASNSAFLTAGGVELVGNALNVNCVQSSDLLNKYLTVSFTLRRGTPGVDQARDIVEETFSSSTNIRSH